MKLSLAEQCNKANIFLDPNEYELNSLYDASHLMAYVSVHAQFVFEIYLLISKMWLSTNCISMGAHLVSHYVSQAAIAKS